MFIKRLLSELKVVFGLTALLPLPALAGMGLLEMLTLHNPAQLSGELARVVLRDFTLLLPLVAAVSSAHLMSVERDEGFAELRSTYREPVVIQILLRTGIAFLFTVAAMMLGWMVYSLFSGVPIPLVWMAPALPPVIFLLGFTLLVNHLSGSYWAAAGAALAYWFLETQTRGFLTGMFYLLNPVWPLPDIDVGLNVLLVVGVGMGFLIANLLFGLRRSMDWRQWGPGRNE